MGPGLTVPSSPAASQLHGVPVVSTGFFLWTAPKAAGSQQVLFHLSGQTLRSGKEMQKKQGKPEEGGLQTSKDFIHWLLFSYNVWQQSITTYTIQTQTKQILTISSKHCIVPNDASTMMREREHTRFWALALWKVKKRKLKKNKKELSWLLVLSSLNRQLLRNRSVPWEQENFPLYQPDFSESPSSSSSADSMSSEVDCSYWCSAQMPGNRLMPAPSQFPLNHKS